MLLLSMCFSQIMPSQAEAAAKKPAVKTVEIRVNGKKVNSKTVTLKQGAKAKVQVVVKPAKAKKSVKSVKWSKLSSKAKKIATIKGNTIKAGKKNGTVKMTVTVKGKNNKSKKAWLKVKVVKTLPKKTTTNKTNTNTSKPSTSTPSKPSTPSTPSKPSKPSVSESVLSLASSRTGKDYYYISSKEIKGSVLVLDKYVPNDTKDGETFIGWYTSNGERVKYWDGSRALVLFARWQGLSDWNPTFVQGNVTLLASDEVYDNDGIKSYGEIVTSYMKEAWVECHCGRKCQFKVRDHKGNVLVIDKFLLTFDERCFVLTKPVMSTKTVSSDWAFLEITSAYDKVCMTQCPCNNIWNARSQMFDPRVEATYNF